MLHPKFFIMNKAILFVIIAASLTAYNSSDYEHQVDATIQNQQKTIDSLNAVAAK